jgi:hypothetical protein
MTETSLEQIEQAYKDLEQLAAPLLAEEADLRAVKPLRDKCSYFRRLTRGTRYGNISFAYLSDTIRLFERSRINLTDARGRLERAMTEIDHAIGIHRVSRRRP